MINLDKKIKLLLLKVNKQGTEVTYTRESKYSTEFNNIYSKYYLTFWNVGVKKTGEIYRYPTVKEFTNQIGLLKYLIKVGEDDE